jgi:hypothetical protein
MQNLPQASTSESQDPYTEIEMETLREILRQARQSFNLHLVAMSASVSIGLIGGGILLLGKTTEGTVTAGAGMISSTLCAQVHKDSQRKLEMLTERLEYLRLPHSS